MVDDVFGRTGRNINPLNLKGRALSALLGISAGTVHRRFGNGAPLVRSGLVSIDNDGDLIVVSRLHRIATVPGDASLDVHRLLLPAAPPSELEWSDFDHIAQDRDHVERLLGGALDAGAPGVNILLHGPPGTGKTEFCKVLADRLGVTLFSRRMMFALELRPPTARVRARIWTRQLERHGIEAKPDEARALAREFEATPGVAAGATAAARLGGGDVEAVRRGVRSLSRVLSCAKPPEGTLARFDLSLIHADVDPCVLADNLVQSAERRFSLCLQGPPGTGKSALVRYLAERLGLEVMQRRASDLMSMWVGETEQQVASAFAEARDAGAFLVFDEADSLLADRRFARSTWEVSQVNEMLTWM